MRLMPLRPGSSGEVVSANIGELIRAGHKPDQAAAIAYKEAGKAQDAWSESDHPRNEGGQFVYHGTNLRNLEGIKKQGLLGGQDPNYFTELPEVARHYAVGAPETKVVLRALKSKLPDLLYAGHHQDPSSGEAKGQNFKTQQRVHPSLLEIEGPAGVWAPLIASGGANDESEEDKEGTRDEPQVHDAAGIIFVAPTGRILFLRRDQQANHGGEWDWPGGHLEPGETLEQGAIREAHEESGFEAPADRVQEVDRRITDDVDFTTFICRVDEMFTPNISRDEFGHREHDDWRWADPRDPPEPLHHNCSDILSDELIEEIIKKGGVAGPVLGEDAWAVIVTALEGDDLLALDKASVRTPDLDGRLHVSLTPITKANICPYMGQEIPYWEELGLQPDRVYRLLRDPQEIEKAAATSNGVPLLEVHKATSAAKHPKGLVVGAVGTDAVWQAPYLFNSLVVWTADAIEGIESEEKVELSSSYRYRADMTPGVFEGKSYDGVMRDLVFNHVALVEQGRAGSDVSVADALGEATGWGVVESAIRDLAA